MKPPPFEYHCPSNLGEALELLAEHGSDARVLAGGQSLIPLLNQRAVSPAVLVDVNKIDELSGLELMGDRLRIGAMTRQSDLEEDPIIIEHFPEIGELLPKLGFPATRHRGTVGGSLAWADPTAELPALALALDGFVELQSAGEGTRTLSVENFLSGPYKTVAARDELLTAIELPLRRKIPAYFLREVNLRATGRAVAGIIAHARENELPLVTLFGWADRARRLPIQVPEKGVESRPEGWVTHFEGDAARPLWHNDPHGTAEYRRFIFGSLVRESAQNLCLI